MANTLLTPSAITKEALSVLHQKLNFIGTVNRQYDDSFAVKGAKIGNSLNIRNPVEYVVSDGATLVEQDTTHTNQTLTVSSRKHVGVKFTTEELTMDLDDFSSLHIEPAMSVLAAQMESDAINTMIKDVYNQVSDVGAAITSKDIGKARKELVNNLAPMGDQMYVLSNPDDNLELVDALKGEQNDAKKTSAQNLDGYMMRRGGFNFMETTLLNRFTSGTDDGTGDYLINGASQTGSTLTVDTGAGTFKQGDIITCGINRVHPETKVDTGELMTFVVTADVSASATSIPISPAISTSGGSQNVTGSPADNAAIYKRESDHSTAIGNAATHGLSLAYHRDAFTFASADLILPEAATWKAREVLDGISMRIVRDYRIASDDEPCRIDVLYGFKTLRPQWACRLAFG